MSMSPMAERPGGNDPERRRVLVIGLDGATFDLLDPWMDRGLMPNLQRLVSTGTRATLQSTMPPVTAPAWTSFATGAGPGQHGIFDFWKREPGQLRRRLVTAEDIRVPPVWSTLMEAGLKVGLVNMPVSYPPTSRMSFAISEWLVPSGSPRFTQPPGLFEELRPTLGEYLMDLPTLPSTESVAVTQFLERIRAITCRQVSYAVDLMRRHEWDFCVVVLMATDWMQHRLWDVLSQDSSHPERVELRRKAEELVAVVDQQIGELKAASPAGTDVIIVSDHGFGPLRRRFKVNQWLASQGLLRPSRRHRVRRWLRRIGLMRLRQLLRHRGRQLGGLPQVPVWQWVDWSGTRAYACSQSDLGIHVNLAGREAAGIVSPGAEYEEVRRRVLEGLTKLRDPETGKPLVTSAFRREELFSGPQVADAPDVVYWMEEGECLASLPLDGPLLEPSDWCSWTGVHRLGGVFVASGPSIRAGGRLAEMQIIDVAPTILRILGFGPPPHVEGRVPEGLLTHEAETLPVRSPKPPTPGGPRETQGAYTEEEAREVEKRLRGLGYL
jgi:predicted AlkP superfamily phosphohydrolase/phosphomutase